jgi:membrane protease YdiL (CAAX protease family)
MNSVFTICCAAVVVITPLVAAAWLPAGFPHALRQVLLFAWGVGAIMVAARLISAETFRDSMRSAGFTRPHAKATAAACLVSLPMWAFLPLTALAEGVDVALRPTWLSLLVGVVLVNGIAEEVIHRAFVFGQLRPGRSFAVAATISAAVFAGQHVYIMATVGWVTGLASVLLAALLSYPLAYAFERGGNSIAGPAVLHTSSNAPVLIFTISDELAQAVLLPYMAVVLMSLYLLFTPTLVLWVRTRMVMSAATTREIWPGTGRK